MRYSVSDVTVIPVTNAALQAVSTPLVTFEQPFEQRAGRIERQLETLELLKAAVVLADTWPDAFHTPMGRRDAAELLRTYGTPSNRRWRKLWPETAIYLTEVAQMFEIDETIVYRPTVHFFSQYCERCHERSLLVDDVAVSPEAAIYTDDRAAYPTEFRRQPLPEIEKELTVITIGECREELPSDAQVIQLSDDSGIALGQRLNAALLTAVGERIAICDGRFENCKDRLRLQLDDDVDLSLSTLKAQPNWAALNYALYVDSPSDQLATFMFSRQLIEHTGGVNPLLSTGVGYELFMHATTCPVCSFKYRKEPVVASEGYVEKHGKLYAQEVYSDIAERARYQQLCHYVGMRGHR